MGALQRGTTTPSHSSNLPFLGSLTQTRTPHYAPAPSLLRSETLRLVIGVVNKVNNIDDRLLVNGIPDGAEQWGGRIRWFQWLRL